VINRLATEDAAYEAGQSFMHDVQSSEMAGGSRSCHEPTDPAAWAIQAGLAGAQELDLLRGFCERAVAIGLPIARAQVLVDTLHPIHEGRVFRWKADRAGEVVEYGRTTENDALADKWRQSPLHHLERTGEPMLRRQLGDDRSADFPILSDLRTQGYTDYLACAHRFAGDGVIGEMDCVYSSWASDAPGGFSEGQVETLCRLSAPLALAVKCASLTRIAATLVETYLGRDAGRRVLEGRIARGVADRIGAVLWFSDLRDFTRITDTTAPEQIIPLLNDYAEAVISAIHEAGGEVLKLMGDGILAIFTDDTAGSACRCALDAEMRARERVNAVSERRRNQGLPTTSAYLSLHVGDVFYGNIGSSDRLDFTVVGPAVNEASRIASLCRSIKRNVLISSAFAASAFEEDRLRLVSVGRHELRGVAHPQELFTLGPDDRAVLSG
jgi:adenylate cyclase